MSNYSFVGYGKDRPLQDTRKERKNNMDLLYKYYSNESNYAFENIENGNICFTPLESLNDPFEGVGAYLYQVSSEEQIYWDTIGSNVPKLVSQKLSEELRDMVNFKYRVFCSSKEFDNPLLWAYYANSHKGFCVGYKESDIREISNDMLDIEYRSEMCTINEFNEDTYRKLLSIKFIDWSMENECRALYILNNSDVSFLHTEVFFDKKKQCDKKMYKLHGHVQTQDLKILCADKFILKKCEPAVIYLGLRMELKDMQRLLDIARKLEIKVYQMSQEQNSFKFIPQELR